MIYRESHFLIFRLFQASNNQIIKNIKQIDLNAGQPKILEYLLENDGAKPVEIAKGCFLDKSTVTGLISRMEKSGLISKCDHGKDKRCNKIFLTDEGKEKAYRVKELCYEVDDKALKGFTKEETEYFLDTVNRVINNLMEDQELEGE